MRNWIIVGFIGLVGMGSTFSFADNLKDKFDFKCHFEACDHLVKNPETIECWVDGSLGKDDDHSITIKCSNGFHLDSREPAVSFADGTLWINADNNHDRDGEELKLATLRIEGDHRDGGDFEHKANLLLSRRENKADRFDGSCKFEKHSDLR